MASEAAASQASQSRHNDYMGFGKKQRYIEVFQCSGEDMNLVLTGHNTTATSPAAKTTPTSPIQGMLTSAVAQGSLGQGQGNMNAAGLLTIPQPFPYHSLTIPSPFPNH